VTIFYAAKSETQCGALAELGACLAAGKRAFIVSDYWWSISNHPNCRVFPSLERAVAAIVAQAKGERVRDEMERERPGERRIQGDWL